MYMVCMIIFITCTAIEGVIVIGVIFWQNGIRLAKCNIMSYR